MRIVKRETMKTYLLRIALESLFKRRKSLESVRYCLGIKISLEMEITRVCIQSAFNRFLRNSSLDSIITTITADVGLGQERLTPK